MEHEHHLPWAVSRQDFARQAGEASDDAACCVFVVDDAIPVRARTGYSALVMAYARSAEPVTVLDGGGAALLIRDGGLAAAGVAAGRVIAQAAKLGLENTLRAGVALIAKDADAAIERARAAAERAGTGTVGSALNR
jgi:hypothetical protein